jgi:hypothetical protein
MRIRALATASRKGLDGTRVSAEVIIALSDCMEMQRLSTSGACQQPPHPAHWSQADAALDATPAGRRSPWDWMSRGLLAFFGGESRETEEQS